MAPLCRCTPRSSSSCVDRNSALERAIGNGEVDIALVFGSEAQGDDSIVGRVPMAWIASQDFKP
jgi:hypothetical protein